MEDLLQLIVFVLFVSGGSCTLAGTWWHRNKKKKKDAGEHQSSK